MLMRRITSTEYDEVVSKVGVLHNSIDRNTGQLLF